MDTPPGSSAGLKLPEHRYAELLNHESDRAQVPSWLAVPVRRQWAVDLAGRLVKDTIIVRGRGSEGMSFGRASYELNMFCNWECPHCYLGQKDDAGLEWDKRSKLLHLLRDAGVVWLQITGGEPTVDRYFPAVYSLAYDLGMMVEVLTNGSRLHHPLLLDVLSDRRPYRITLSLYGATEATYDRLTQRKARGSRSAGASMQHWAPGSPSSSASWSPGTTSRNSTRCMLLPTPSACAPASTTT